MQENKENDYTWGHIEHISTNESPKQTSHDNCLTNQHQEPPSKPVQEQWACKGDDNLKNTQSKQINLHHFLIPTSQVRKQLFGIEEYRIDTAHLVRNGNNDSQ